MAREYDPCPGVRVARRGQRRTANVGVQVVVVDIELIANDTVFRQIADWIRSEIRCAKLPPGARLPSERALANGFHTTRTTARHALSVLRSEGLIVSEQGRGAFVRRSPTVRRLTQDRFAFSQQTGRNTALSAGAEIGRFEADVELVSIRRGKASPDISRRLGLDCGSPVLVMQYRSFVDGQPAEVATSYVPSTHVAGSAMMRKATAPGDIYAWLEANGHCLTRFAEEVKARMPTPEEVGELHLDAGVPVIALLRTAIDHSGAAVEVCDTVLAGDKFVLEYEVAQATS